MPFGKRTGRPISNSGTAPSRFLFVSVTAAALAVLGTGAAAADTQAPSAAKPQPSKSAGAAMKIVAFDPAVAARYGYEIRTAPNGRQYSVKRGTSPRALPQSAGGGEVTGDCGTSRVTITGTGDSRDRLETSWSVHAPVTAFTWDVSIIDHGGVSNQTWGPRSGPNAAKWSDSRTLTHMTHGPVEARVSSDSSVVLATGAVCYSGSPHASGTTT